MLHSVSAQANQQPVRHTEQPQGKFSFLTNRSSSFLKRLGLVVIPAIALMVFSNLPTVAADINSYLECIQRCTSSGSSPAWCSFLCTPCLVAP